MSENPVALAKVIWENPETGQLQEYVLNEGATVTIGRGADNEIHINERVVSRHHATIQYRCGLFVVSDAGSANGVFVNDERVSQPYPLIDGDVIRLYMPTMKFIAILPDDTGRTDPRLPEPSTTEMKTTLPRVVITSGPLTGSEISLNKETITFGRAISNANWEVRLPDHAVSRPHARIFAQQGNWYVEDLNSANGTMVEGVDINHPVLLQDGATVTMGETVMVFYKGN